MGQVRVEGKRVMPGLSECLTARFSTDAFEVFDHCRMLLFLCQVERCLAVVLYIDIHAFGNEKMNGFDVPCSRATPSGSLCQVIQKLFIENKKRWVRMPEVKRLEYATAKIEAACSIPIDPSDEDCGKSYYELVTEGHLTETELMTIKRLAMNAHSLKIKIDDAELSSIAKKRYDKNKKGKKKIKYDFDAYEQLVRDMVDRTLEPRFRVDPYGRLHVPMTNIPRQLWNYTFYKKKQLSGVDIKTSHPYCLLALLKDISINYFSGMGTHEERLANCQFSQQIAMIPGLVEHLRQCINIYIQYEHFELKKHIPDDMAERRKMMHMQFERFTKIQDKIKLDGCGYSKVHHFVHEHFQSDSMNYQINLVKSRLSNANILTQIIFTESRMCNNSENNCASKLTPIGLTGSGTYRNTLPEQHDGSRKYNSTYEQVLFDILGRSCTTGIPAYSDISGSHVPEGMSELQRKALYAKKLQQD